MGYSRWLMATLLISSIGMTTAAADAPTPEQRKRLIEQKLRLVEMLAASPAARAAAAAREAEANGQADKGKQLLEQARQALAANELDQAAAALDEALRSATKASAKGGLSESALRQSYKDLSEQVATYRASILEVSDPAAKTLLARVDGTAADAQRLAAESRLGEANKKLAEAYKLAVQGLSKLRAGQEVVMSLKFASPAEEYAYEQKRLRSSEIIADMLLGEGRAEGEKRKMVDAFIADSRATRSEAEAHAGAERYKEAVTSMEKAAQQINRALQLMGVPMF